MAKQKATFIAKKVWHCEDCRKHDENWSWEVQTPKGVCIARLYCPEPEATAVLLAASAELLAALKALIEQSGHMSPFGPDASVKNIRKAGKYMGALDTANALIAKVEG